MDKEILDAVRKKAMGYTSEECALEMVVVDGEMQTVKKKVTIKEFPPDISAVKCLVELGKEKPLEEMTIEELESEKRRLLKQLKGEENENSKS